MGQVEQDRAGQQFGLEGAVEAFVFALGLGMVRSAVPHLQAEPHEPHREDGVRMRGVATTPRAAVVSEQPLR